MCSLSPMNIFPFTEPLIRISRGGPIRLWSQAFMIFVACLLCISTHGSPVERTVNRGLLTINSAGGTSRDIGSPAAMEANVQASASGSFVLLDNTVVLYSPRMERPGVGVLAAKNLTIDVCAIACKATDGCKAFMFRGVYGSPGSCELKSSQTELYSLPSSEGVILGLATPVERGDLCCVTKYLEVPSSKPNFSLGEDSARAFANLDLPACQAACEAQLPPCSTFLMRGLWNESGPSSLPNCLVFPGSVSLSQLIEDPLFTTFSLEAGLVRTNSTNSTRPPSPSSGGGRGGGGVNPAVLGIGLACGVVLLVGVGVVVLLLRETAKGTRWGGRGGGRGAWNREPWFQLLLEMSSGAGFSFSGSWARRRRQQEQQGQQRGGGVDQGLEHLRALALSSQAQMFTVDEMRVATNEWAKERVLGHGGFGVVYRGRLESGVEVAVKRRYQRPSYQGGKEFHNEVALLLSVQHRHVLKLVGFCCEQGEHILVYELMPNGSVRSHLYDENGPLGKLDFMSRLRIAVLAARAIEYLHVGCSQPIIHRDLKTSNLLLDADLQPCIADFGLARSMPELASSAGAMHVSTAVKGTAGYLDPEYCNTYQLREKSDVFSFGVCLLELLTGRPPMDRQRAPGGATLVAWAHQKLQLKDLDKFVDPTLDVRIHFYSLSKFVETAMLCVEPLSLHRPTMRNVERALGMALWMAETEASAATAPSRFGYLQGGAFWGGLPMAQCLGEAAGPSELDPLEPAPASPRGQGAFWGGLPMAQYLGEGEAAGTSELDPLEPAPASPRGQGGTFWGGLPMAQCLGEAAGPSELAPQGSWGPTLGPRVPLGEAAGPSELPPPEPAPPQPAPPGPAPAAL